MIYKRGKNQTWWMRFRFGGRFIHEGTRTNSKTLARDAERQRRRELEQSWNRVERRTMPPTFERSARDWLAAEKPHLAQRTWEIHDVAIRCHLTPVLGPRLLCDIDAAAVASYQAKRKSAEASARTINKELQVLRQILKRHKLWSNLQGEVKFEREHNDVGKALTRGDENRLLNAWASNPLLSAVVTLALNTASARMKYAPYAGIRLILRSAHSLWVGQKTLAGSGRVIPLNQPAFGALAKWAGRLVEADHSDYVPV